MRHPPNFGRRYAPRPVHRRARPSRTLLATLAVAGLLWSSQVQAQQPWLTIIVVDEAGLMDTEIAELAAGLEGITSDFGEFELIPFAELSRDLDRSDVRRLGRCSDSPSCYSSALLGTGIDHALVVLVSPAADELNADFLGINLHTSGVEATASGNFPTASDALFLLVPVYEVLGPLGDAPIDADAREDREDPDDREERDNSNANASNEADSDDDDQRNDAITRPAPASETNTLAMALTVGGGAFIATGIGFWLLADSTHQDIQSAPHERDELASLQDSGSTQQTLGNLFFFTGLTSLITGIVFEFTGIGTAGSDDFNDELLRLDITPHGDASIHFEMEF